MATKYKHRMIVPIGTWEQYGADVTITFEYHPGSDEWDDPADAYVRDIEIHGLICYILPATSLAKEWLMDRGHYDFACRVVQKTLDRYIEDDSYNIFDELQATVLGEYDG